ncbi:MAG: glycosyltransferase family 2 protein [Pyrinomonadaceae bacterium]
MNVVIAMAGRGARFRDAGWETPKPLIPVRGEPMYSWALKGLPLELASRVVIITTTELGDDPRFRADLGRRYRHLPVSVVTTTRVTEGQACTVLLARDLIDTGEPLMIFNADTYQRSRALPLLARDPTVDGALSVFCAPGEKWSFVRADESGRVVETAEKRRISEWASTGLYYFARGRDFVAAAEEMISGDERVGGEFYVAPVYNRLIGRGANVRLDPVEEVHVFGTPEDLRAFLAGHEELIAYGGQTV